MNLNQSDLEAVCENLLNDFDGVFSWKWDNRFDALLAEFSTDMQDDIRTILERHLKMEWDILSFSKAPKIIKRATSVLGDLRSNQLLFTSDPEGEIFKFAAWWPWDNGKVISVRIASPTEKDVNNEESQELQAKFKSLFS